MLNTFFLLCIFWKFLNQHMYFNINYYFFFFKKFYFLIILGSVLALASTNNGKILISGSYDESIKLWDLTQSGKCSQTLPKGHSGTLLKINDLCSFNQRIEQYAICWYENVLQQKYHHQLKNFSVLLTLL